MNYAILHQWEQEIAQHLPGLNSWQVANLALFSYGIIAARHCQEQVVSWEVRCQEQIESTIRRWRRYLNNKALNLERFFGEWSNWIISVLGQSQVTLLVDETKLHDRIGVMMVSLAWQERSIPLAWRTYKANSAADYPAEGQVGVIRQLLEHIQAGVPVGVSVVVQADRGIGSSSALCRVVEDLGWYYLFRVTRQISVRFGHRKRVPLVSKARPGERWAGCGMVFQGKASLFARALTVWHANYEQPWLLITNHAYFSGEEYVCRNWQEQSFRDMKSAGWNWDRSYIRHPDHAARLLVLITLATAWMIALGCHAAVSDQAAPLRKAKSGQLRRNLSLFKDGLRFFTCFLRSSSFFVHLAFSFDHRFT